ncbi:hypothetical protein D0T53_07985 [Dysgonomonas sp. 216]|uniref:hypothetical protein n=1 Tax=Dysgonomonas sp. 216 TaxID=2302934 RepID=UPI0013D6DB5B|nr:hypothetical protein [Dysgonomonas sp. 216]NDW18850.1 hypothetical protein [Dysgonomonas sp. 216]
MGKAFIISLILLSYSTCGHEDVYCWECESIQDDYSWSEVFHEWSEEDIDQLIEDDYNEYTPIYTTCYKIGCSRHDCSY